MKVAQVVESGAPFTPEWDYGTITLVKGDMVRVRWHFALCLYWEDADDLTPYDGRLKRDSDQPKAPTTITLDGFVVSVFRDETDGMVTVQILTQDAKARDHFDSSGVPRLRVVVNDSGETTNADGSWEGEDV